MVSHLGHRLGQDGVEAGGGDAVDLVRGARCGVVHGEQQLLAEQVDLFRPRAAAEHEAEVDVDDGQSARVDHDVGQVAVRHAEDVAQQDGELHGAAEDLPARVEGIAGGGEQILAQHGVGRGRCDTRDGS